MNSIFLVFVLILSTVSASYPRYIGCFYATQSYSEFNYTFNDASMTQQLCLTTCHNKGYKIAGVGAGSYCSCGNTFGSGIIQGNNRYVWTSDSTCDTSCSGNSAQICGGDSYQSIYQLTTTPPDYQWAYQIQAYSSYYYNQFDASMNYTPFAILGSNDVYPEYQDTPLFSWTASGQGNPGEYLEFSIPIAVQITNVSLYETFVGGHATHIATKVQQSDPWTYLWNGTIQAGQTGQARIFQPQLNVTSFESSYLRIVFDFTNFNNTVNLDTYELDCVKVVGKSLAPIETSPPTTSGLSKKNKNIVIGVVVPIGILLIVGVVLAIVFIIRREIKKLRDGESEGVAL